MTDFTAFFNRHFQVLTDTRGEVANEAFRLRYQVYCVERGFESREHFSDGRERDGFDSRSLHGIVRHRGSGTTMASVRLAASRADEAAPAFPLEQPYPDLLSRHGICDRRLPRRTTREISRFAISKDCRRRVRTWARAGRTVAHTTALDWRFNGRRYPMVTFGLFVALMRLSALNGVTHWLAVMEPSLLRLLARFGVEFTPIGGMIDYHGHRQPCYGRVDQIRGRVQRAEDDLAELVHKDIAWSHLKAAS